MSAAQDTPGEGVRKAVFTRTILWIAVLVLCLLCRISDVEKVFNDGKITFFDSDTYTRMERVRQVETSGGRPVRFHHFENAPLGIVSHATSPLDYLILALSLPIRPFTSPQNARDLAGAWISPAVGLATLVLLIVLLRGLRGRWWVAFAYSVLPALSWAQNIGRPDHQSLLTALLALALAAEWRLLGRQVNQGRVVVFCGIFWGLALWVSLFEPLILGLFYFALSAILCRGWWKRSRGFWTALAIPLVLRFVVDPWPVLPPASDAGWLRNWGMLIGELRGSTVVEMIYWTGLWCPLLIVVAALILKRYGLERRAIFTLASLLLLGVLTFWQIRWSPYLALMVAVPGMLLFLRVGRDPRKIIAVVLCYAPIALYYVNFHLRWKQPAEGVAELRQAAELISKDRAIILAPWWISPALGYLAQAPVVASSSHQSIQGIVDVSEFLLTPHWDMAREILLGREVGWVVTAEPERMYSQSMAVAHGTRTSEDEKVLWRDVSYRVAMGTRLARGLSPAPDELVLAGVFGPYRVYRFLPRRGGATPD